MTEERKQEILEIIRNTNRRPAQTGKPLYPEEIMAYPNLCEEIESISRTVDGFSYRMDILRAKNRGKNCPLFINIHGGGFIGPHRENDTYFSAYMADQIHGIAVDLDYTLSDAAPYPVALHQCMDALDYVAEHANTWGASAKDISVGGYSAGGALTAAMGICCAERRRLCAKTSDFVLSSAGIPYPGSVQDRCLRPPDWNGAVQGICRSLLR